MTKEIAQVKALVGEESRLYGEFSEAELVATARAEWGWLVEERIAPVWVSEVGGASAEECAWLARIFAYIRAVDGDFAWWPVNVGEKPGQPGSEESYGIVGPDWRPCASGWRAGWAF